MSGPRTDRADLYAVLDEGLVCHVGIVRDGAPVVLPTGYGRIDDTRVRPRLDGRGLAADRRRGTVCLTVTHLDGIVYARSVFHHSMNYRSAVVHGPARLVTDPAERLAALRAVSEQLSPGSWEHAREPNAKELAATVVVALDLAEASVKVRSGPPGDEDFDIAAGGRWAGVLPVVTTFGDPQPDPTLDAHADTGARQPSSRYHGTS